MAEIGYSCLGAASQQTEPEINHQIVRLGQSIESATVRLDSLVSQLQAVLGPAYPAPQGSNQVKDAEPTCSPVASNLRGLVEKVELIEATINQTINRLEVG